MDLVHNNTSIVSHMLLDTPRQKGAGALTAGSGDEPFTLVLRYVCASV